MTKPVNPWDSITAADSQAAMGGVTKMMTGTKMLQDEPGIVYSLAAQHAHPADAGAIDQFMQGLDAEKQVRLAQATGQKLILNDTQKGMLDNLGVDYSTVAYTTADAQHAGAKAIATGSGGKEQAAKNPDGTYKTDAKGNLVVEPVAYLKPAYKAKGIGRLFQTLNNDVLQPIGRDVLEPAGTVLSKGWNLVNSTASDSRQAAMGGVTGDSYGQSIVSRSTDMTAEGYDPTNLWSALAFQSSGKAHGNTQPLADQWDTAHPAGMLGMNGDQAVSEVEAFLNDPKAYRSKIESDPANFTVDAKTHQTSVTPAGAAKLQAMNSPVFADLARQVSGKTASIGNDVANGIGLDPLKHPTEYALTAAGVNIAASFAIDPTLVALKVAQVSRISKIGIDSLNDVNGAVSVLDGSRGANSVQRGWQQMIDLTGQMREAHAAGDTVKAAGLQAKIDASLPGLSPLTADFVGTQMLRHPKQWAEHVGANGEKALTPTFEAGPGIRSLADATDYIGSRYALIRLTNGRAATQSSLMPGTLSAFGYRKLKGATAQWMTERSALRQFAAYDAKLDTLTADPARLAKAITDGDVMRMGPAADDAVSVVTDNVIAHKPLVNLHDDVQSALSKVQSKTTPLKADIKSLHGELDGLEARLQGLQADRTADPAHLAVLHDQIQTGRDAVAMQEKTLASHSEAEANLAKVHADMSAQENKMPHDDWDFPNGEVGKGAPSGPVNTRHNPLSPDVSYALTGQGRGKVAFNLRKIGDPLGDLHPARGDRNSLGWSSPTAVAARARLAAQRFTTLLPRNTMIDLNDSASGDKMYKMAMTYLNRGDARGFQAAWNLGDGGVRKSLIGGLMDQIGHAAGLGHTVSGQKILDSMKTQAETYSSIGDDVMLDGQALALHAGQVRTVWTLPTFKEVQFASAKIGLWESTLGRPLTSQQADLLMSQWKLGALLKPSTVTRNQLEGWGRTAIEGKAGDAVRAKALLTTPNKELWAHGFELDQQAAHAEETAAAASDVLNAQTATEKAAAKVRVANAKAWANGSRLSGSVLGRSTPGKALAEFAPVALAGRAYRAMTGRFMDDAHVEAMLTLGKDELSTALEEYGQQIREAELGTRRAAKEAGDIAKAGFGPATVRRAVNVAARKGDPGAKRTVKWTKQDVDGTVGADRFENALAQRVNATPDVARAVIDHLHDPGKYTIDHVIKALDDPKIADRMRLTSYGRVTWDDPNGPARLAMTDAERLLGKRDFAEKMVNDYRHLFTGQNGQLQTKLTSEIYKTGRAPSSDWITTALKGDNRPESVLAPEVMAMPNGGERSLVQALQDIEGGAFEWMVERPLHRTTSSPVFMANYADARVGLNDVVDRLVNEHGFSREASNNFAKELSIKNSWIKTENLIDDPGQKSQFDIVARNMFPFSRATQAMIRRWGSGVWQNPAGARKLMLAYEGAQQSGFIYDNAYGEPTFTYPGSGVLNMVMREVSKIPGFEGLNYFPMSSTMTGGALMAVPGADNPFRMGMGPMMSIPMRELFGLFPNHRAMLDEVDAAINGPIGVGQTWSQLSPTVAKHFYGAMDSNKRDSALASSTVGAIANLAAAGLIPPADASPGERDAFIQRVSTQARNNLIVRALFGLVAPAAPSAPQEGNAATDADYVFQESGMKTLSDEYKTILNETGGDLGRALAVWSTLHPDLYVTKDGKAQAVALPSAIAVSHSQATTSKVALPATANALNWMESNSKFIDKYKGVAAYFLPQSAGTQEPFNDRAYNTQIELGLRQRKSAQEFYTDVRVRNAEATFYPAADGFNARIKAAHDAGDKAAEATWTLARHNWEAKFKAQNPLFAARMDAYPDARATAMGQLADLHAMLKNREVPAGQGPLLTQLVANYDNYAAFIAQHPGQQQEAKRVRDASLAMFNQWATEHVANSPLADLYAGVFRTLNTNLVNLVGG